MKTILITFTIDVPEDVKPSVLWDLAKAAASGRLKSGLEKCGGQVADYGLSEKTEGGDK